MKNTDPILNFRLLNEMEQGYTDIAGEAQPVISERHTTITKTREAADSSEHSDTSI